MWLKDGESVRFDIDSSTQSAINTHECLYVMIPS
jgi:hypothetical protein